MYFYTPKEKGQCLAFEGEKKLLRWFRGHLVVVSAANRQPLGSAFMHMTSEGQRETVNLSIYDIKNSFVAFTGTFHGGVVDVVGEWGCLFVVTRDHKLVRLEEYDMQSKLQVSLVHVTQLLLQHTPYEIVIHERHFYRYL